MKEYLNQLTYNWLPVFSAPAVQANVYEIDKDTIDKRIKTAVRSIFTGAFVCLSYLTINASIKFYQINFVKFSRKLQEEFNFADLTVKFMGIILLSLTCLILVTEILEPYEKKRAQEAANLKADLKAVDEYLKLEHPSTFARYRIQGSYRAAAWLYQKGGDPTKLDEKGIPLSFDFTDDTSRKIFRLFENQLSLTTIQNNGKTYLEAMLKEMPIGALKWVPFKSPISTLIPISKQMTCLLDNAYSKERTEFLLNHGLDINMRDEQGFTPLLRLLENYQPSSDLEVLKRFLKLGADPSVTVNYKNEVRDALFFIKDLQAIKCIQKAMKKKELGIL